MHHCSVTNVLLCDTPLISVQGFGVAALTLNDNNYQVARSRRESPYWERFMHAIYS